MTRHIDVRSTFNDSATLMKHIERRVAAALRSHAAHVEDIVLKLLDSNGPRGGADDKVVRISVGLKPWGRLVASAASDNIYCSVDRVARRLKSAIQRHRSRLKSRRTDGAVERPRPRRINQDIVGIEDQLDVSRKRLTGGERGTLPRAACILCLRSRSPECRLVDDGCPARM
jgi:ribosome-associated translation inhibitor RaiA